MNNKKLLSYSITQLKKIYEKTFPWLIEIMAKSRSKNELMDQLAKLIDQNNSAAAERIRLMISYEDKTINELSTGEPMTINSFTSLWKFLINDFSDCVNTDIFIDFYYLFLEIEHSINISVKE